MNDVPLPVLWLSGPSGAGKSSASWEVFAQLGRGGVRAAFVDADQIALCYPLPDDTHRLRARNLAAMLPNFVREGARCLVLAGFVDTPEEVSEYTSRLPGAAFTVCRLRVEEAELERRFLARGWRPELVGEAVAEARAQDRTSYADLTVDTTGLTVPETARLIRERAGGWPRGGGVIHGLTGPGRPAPRTDGEAVPVVWFTGATAVGKSTIGYEVFGTLVRTGVRAAYIDLKQIGALRPAPDDDPGGHRLKARNLAAVWAGHRAAGARCLVVSGGADSGDAVRAYAGLLPGTALTVCRLHAAPETLAGRVDRRARGQGPALPGDELRGLAPDAVRRVAERAVREAKALDRDAAGDLRVETDGRSVREIAADLSDRIMNGLIGARSTQPE